MIALQENNRIDQAKALLIARERITEAQAHRLIQKRAMDLRIGKTEYAIRIIARYDRSLERNEKEGRSS